MRGASTWQRRSSIEENSTNAQWHSSRGGERKKETRGSAGGASDKGDLLRSRLVTKMNYWGVKGKKGRHGVPRSRLVRVEEMIQREEP